MKFNKYLLCAVAALAAFGCGIGMFDLRNYFASGRVGPPAAAKTVAPEPRKTVADKPPRPASVEPVTAVPEKTDDPGEKSVCPADYSGDYYIIGKLPKGFKDFETLTIKTIDYSQASAENDYAGVPVPPEGSLLTGREFKFTRIDLAGKRISFVTEKKKGISYEFAGKFVEDRKSTDEETDYPELKGRLIKWSGGQKIAESRIDLGIMCGC